MTVEENIAQLKGAKLKRFKQILKWRERKGVEYNYGHVKFLHDDGKEPEELQDGDEDMKDQVDYKKLADDLGTNKKVAEVEKEGKTE